MRIFGMLSIVFLSIVATGADAITVDELIAKNIEARGGIEKIKAIQSIRLIGKIRFGSTELAFVHMGERPAKVRNELSWQGLTSVDAYDGSIGWRISPFQGRLDPEKVSADERKSMQLESDIDGPLVDYKAKGHTVEYLGTEDVDGTDAHKLKVTLKNSDVHTIYLDPDYFLEIRTLDQTRIRGTMEEYETDLGNYEQVNGVYFPFSVEIGGKGQPKGQKITFEKAEGNVDIDDSLFHFPEPESKSK